MTDPKSGPVSVHVEQVDEPIDIDRWVQRYVEIGMRIQGIAPGGGLLDDQRGSMSDDDTVPASAVSR